MEEEVRDLLARRRRSKFRSRFQLRGRERRYLEQKGLATVMSHGREFIERRLAPAYLPNDGKQTPMRNHPVFIAQHATATCCRGCLVKWHGIPEGRELSEEEIAYVLRVIEAWLTAQGGG